MKLIFLILFITTISHGETWLEVRSTAHFNVEITIDNQQQILKSDANKIHTMKLSPFMKKGSSFSYCFLKKGAKAYKKLLAKDLATLQIIEKSPNQFGPSYFRKVSPRTQNWLTEQSFCESLRLSKSKVQALNFGQDNKQIKLQRAKRILDQKIPSLNFNPNKKQTANRVLKDKAIPTLYGDGKTRKKTANTPKPRPQKSIPNIEPPTTQQMITQVQQQLRTVQSLQETQASPILGKEAISPTPDQDVLNELLFIGTFLATKPKLKEKLTKIPWIADYIRVKTNTSSNPSKPGSLFPFLLMLVSLLNLVAVCKIFAKAGYPPLLALIPFYNIYLLGKMAKLSTGLILMLFIPGINIFAYFAYSVHLAKSFGKNAGTALGLALFPYIFYPILGFDNSVYIYGLKERTADFFKNSA